MKMTVGIFLAVIMILGTFCACKNETPSVTETETVTESGNVPETEKKIVTPLPSTLDVTALQTDSRDLNVAFAEGDIYKDENGEIKAKVEVFDYELFDLVDISALKEGDTIVLRGKEVVVDTIERDGYIRINGGIQNGGYDLSTDESGVYYETGFNDHKEYISLGEVVLNVDSEVFAFIDNFDLDNPGKTYTANDFLAEEAAFMYHFVPQNTTIHIENGSVVEMIRVYMP